MVEEGWGNKDKAGRLPGKLLPQSRPKTVKICTIMGRVRDNENFCILDRFGRRSQLIAEELCIERERESQSPY